MGAAGPALGLQAAGAATSAYGAYTEGLAQDNYYKYLAAQNDRKAADVRKRGDQESSAAQDQGLYQAVNAQKGADAFAGTQKTAIAANMGGGSATAADITTDSFNKARLDQLAIRYNADVKSRAAKNNAAMEAFDLESQAAGYRAAGNSAKRAGKLGAFNTLLSGSGQVAGSYLRANQAAPSANF